MDIDFEVDAMRTDQRGHRRKLKVYIVLKNGAWTERSTATTCSGHLNHVMTQSASRTSAD